MNEKDYSEKALRTDLSPEQYTATYARLADPNNLRLLHALMGMQTEVGELMDQLKRHLFYGKAIDITNLQEEIGDVDWYRNLAIKVVADIVNWDSNLTNEIIHGKNIAKLLARYPEKFDEAKALNRDLENERQTLEIWKNDSFMDKYL